MTPIRRLDRICLGRFSDCPLAARVCCHHQRLSDTLLTILNDVLDLSKIEAGCLSIEPVSVRLRELIAQIGSLVASKADDKNVELVLRVDPSAPAMVRADPTGLRQVILNLLSNAIKFTQAGHVRLSVDFLGEADNHSRLRFSVSDTGIGTPANKLNAIFDRFTQADESTTRNFGGTGLGLTISKGLVELITREATRSVLQEMVESWGAQVRAIRQ